MSPIRAMRSQASAHLSTIEGRKLVDVVERCPRAGPANTALEPTRPTVRPYPVDEPRGWAGSVPDVSRWHSNSQSSRVHGYWMATIRILRSHDVLEGTARWVG